MGCHPGWRLQFPLGKCIQRRVSYTSANHNQAVYKGVRSWSRRALEKAGERVMDVPLPDDEEEDENNPSSEKSEQRKKEE